MLKAKSPNVWKNEISQSDCIMILFPTFFSWFSYFTNKLSLQQSIEFLRNYATSYYPENAQQINKARSVVLKSKFILNEKN